MPFTVMLRILLIRLVSQVGFSSVCVSIAIAHGVIFQCADHSNSQSLRMPAVGLPIDASPLDKSESEPWLGCGRCQRKMIVFEPATQDTLFVRALRGKFVYVRMVFVSV
jgi:hypothetical protein